MQLARASRLFTISGVFFVLALSGAATLLGQDENRRTRVPLIGQVSGGSHRQAFSGIVQKVDIKRKLLLVETVEGGSTEYFPVKKNFRVSFPSGKKIKLSKLSSGTNVIVYFRVNNDDRRIVTDIFVLESKDGDQAEEDAKERSSPS